MADRFSQTSLAVRVMCCLRLAASTADQISVIRPHSVKCSVPYPGTAMWAVSEIGSDDKNYRQPIAGRGLLRVNRVGDGQSGRAAYVRFPAKADKGGRGD